MTTIKFRGFRVDGKGWAIGSYVHDEEWAKHYIYTKEIVGAFFQLVRHEIHPSSLGMFTGQTDKNGKEIYGAIGDKGGDVITMGEFAYFVKFENGCFRVFSKIYKTSDGTPLIWGDLSKIWDLDWQSALIIIGNQWEADNGK